MSTVAAVCPRLPPEWADSLELRADAAGRRLVYARRALAAGVVCFTEHVTCFVPSGDCFDAVCHACLALIMDTEHACSQCRLAVFCSAECARAADHWHEHECRALQWLAHTPQGADMPVSVERLVLAGRVLLAPSPPSLADFARPSSAALLTDAFEPMDEACATLTVAAIIRYVTAGAGAASLAAFEDLSAGIRAWQRALQSNAVPLTEPVTGARLAVALAPLLSSVAHSCRPNCVFDSCGTEVTVRALRALAAGEPLSVDYCAHAAAELRTTYERRFYLAAQFGLHCTCAMCHDSDIGRDALSERDRQIAGYRCSDSGCAGVFAWRPDADVDTVRCSQCSEEARASALESRFDALEDALLATLSGAAADGDVQPILAKLAMLLAPTHAFHYRWAAMVASSIDASEEHPSALASVLRRLLTIAEAVQPQDAQATLRWQIQHQQANHATREQRTAKNDIEAEDSELVSAQLPRLLERTTICFGAEHPLVATVHELLNHWQRSTSHTVLSETATAEEAGFSPF